MATVVEQAAGKSLKLELTRVIKASKQRVFDAWTRPEFVRQWFGPAEKECTLAETDARVGGAYTLELRGAGCTAEGAASDEVRTSRATGRYIKVDPYDLLQFTWRWNPDAPETLVTVALREVDGGTEIKLTHEGFATEGERDAHQHGWSGSLDKLERFAETE